MIILKYIRFLQNIYIIYIFILNSNDIEGKYNAEFDF